MISGRGRKVRLRPLPYALIRAEDKKRFFVNCWGRTKRINQIKTDEEEAAAAASSLSCGTVKYTIAKTTEVSHSETNTFEDLRSVVAPFCIAV